VRLVVDVAHVVVLMLEITGRQQTPARHIGRDFMIQALSGIAAALGAKALGA
jgi:hypothetical protein